MFDFTGSFFVRAYRNQFHWCLVNKDPIEKYFSLFAFLCAFQKFRNIDDEFTGYQTVKVKCLLRVQHIQTSNVWPLDIDSESIIGSLITKFLCSNWVGREMRSKLNKLLTMSLILVILIWNRDPFSMYQRVQLAQNSKVVFERFENESHRPNLFTFLLTPSVSALSCHFN